MSGIYGVLSKKNKEIKGIYDFFHSSKMPNVVNEEFEYNNFIYGRSVLDKFLNDRVLYEDGDLIIGFEGFFFNKQTEKSYDTIKQWYVEKSMDFVNDIKGQFSGFIFDKKLNKLFLFNDNLSTKPLYIYSNDDMVIFASELKVISILLSELKIEKELDYDAVYSMLTFGYILNNLTYIKNTKKLKYASILEVDEQLIIKENSYFVYNQVENFNLSKKEIIDEIDRLLLNSVNNCWNKDLEYNYNHYSLLSGGLDSRVNLLVAKELKYKEIMTMTYSQSKSGDQQVAQKIAKEEKFKHLFYSLDNGLFLEKDLENYVFANDGLANLIGVASGYDFLSGVTHNKYGALHTGQIGDVLFGSTVKSNFSLEKGMMSDRIDLLDKMTFINEFQNKYNDNPEIFGFEQRQQHGTLNGDRMLSCFTDLLSPFYDRELISFCLTIPKKYKKNEAIYLDYFNEKHKNIANYPWESAGVKPINITYVKIAQNIKRYKNALLRRLGFSINDMNPFDVWLRKNNNIQLNLNATFESNIKYIKDEELVTILKEMYYHDIKYSSKGRYNKFLIVTFILAIKLHFFTTHKNKIN